MTLTPKILPTNTKHGEITIVRRRYLKSQIAMLEEQVKKVKKLKPKDLFERTGFTTFIYVIERLNNAYKIELFNLIECENQYNS